MAGPSGSIPVTCLKCGHKFKEPVARVKRVSKLICPRCGEGFDPKSLAAGLKKVEKAQERFIAAIKKIGKRKR